MINPVLDIYPGAGVGCAQGIENERKPASDIEVAMTGTIQESLNGCARESAVHFPRRRARIRVRMTLSVILFLLYGPLPTLQAFKQAASSQQSPSGASLKICLRLPDDSPFDGSANIRVIPTEGYEVTGVPTESRGETLFRDVESGTYSIEASAPGFLTVRRTTQIRPGRGTQTIFKIGRAHV